MRKKDKEKNVHNRNEFTMGNYRNMTVLGYAATQLDKPFSKDFDVLERMPVAKMPTQRITFNILRK